MYDVVVIGAGPAGISASIQLKRSGIEPLLLEKDEAGGLLLNANLVENYPGFPDGTSGEKLAEVFLEHLKNTGVVLRKETVKKVFKEKNIFRIVTDKGETPQHEYVGIKDSNYSQKEISAPSCEVPRKMITKTARFLWKSPMAFPRMLGKRQSVFRNMRSFSEIFAKCVILATGTLPKKLGIRGETDIVGRRLFYAIKDLPANTGTFAVIGGGDIAFDYAINLSKTAEKIDILIRGKKEKCIPVLAEKAERKANIKIHYGAIPVSVKEEGNVVLECSVDDECEVFVSDYVLVAAGRTPNTGMLNDELKEHVAPGLFLAGDVKNKDFRQTGIAVGDGLLSAMKAVKFLREKHEGHK